MRELTGGYKASAYLCVYGCVVSLAAILLGNQQQVVMFGGAATCLGVFLIGLTAELRSIRMRIEIKDLDG